MIERERRGEVWKGVLIFLFIAYLVGGATYAFLFATPGPPLDWWEDDPYCPGAPYTTAC